MPDQEMIVAYRASSDAEAAMLIQDLEAVGIMTAKTGGISGAAAFGDLPADSLLVEIWIPREQADLARKTIEEAQERKSRNEEEWTCQECREENEGGFEICWSCQAAKVGAH